MLTVIQISKGPRKVWNSVKVPGIELLDFRITPTGQSDFTMPESIAATPARYIQAAIARAKKWNMAGPIFIFNPLVDVLPEYWGVIPEMLDSLPEDASAAVFATLDDTPLAYWFSEAAWEFLTPQTRNILRFLSSCSASLDELLLAKLFGQSLRVVPVPFECPASPSTGFETRANYLLYRSMTSHCIRLLHAWSGDDRERGITAVMPYHAGDVLFFCKALAETNHTVRRLVVNRQFADIAERIVPDIERIPIIEPAPGRRSSDTRVPPFSATDVQYFFRNVFLHIPRDAPYYYFRPVRPPPQSHFHLTDQWKFSLTDDPFTRVQEREVRFTRPLNVDKSILFHFEGGWSLRVYPQAWQQEVINRAMRAGFRATVLGGSGLSYPCPRVDFRSTDQLGSLIGSHSFVVGLDSFPAHYAVHVLRHPTICLFSASHPDNSGVPISNGFRALQKGLTCSPCTGSVVCPRFGGNQCKNFSEPNEVMTEIEALYTRIEGRST